MSVSAEMYIVISLMFAVFSAVAAVGTSIVLGAGFERLRAGFEVVRRQTGFFADAIHKLDERTQILKEETTSLKEGLSVVGEKAERVDRQSAFFTDSLFNLEQKVELLSTKPMQDLPMDKLRRMEREEEPLLPRDMDYLMADQKEMPNEDILTNMKFSGGFQVEESNSSRSDKPFAASPVAEPVIQQKPEGLSHLLGRYFRGYAQEHTYH